eukprot:m.240185 g.240185  ORF g.240185 m.240185 type:complete len:391 (+) comp14611_c0_seq1:539-1711(+)
MLFVSVVFQSVLALLLIVFALTANGIERKDSQCDGKVDGERCDDGNSFTRADSCTNNVCTGVCTGVYYQGTCQSSCPSPLVEDGGSCSSLATECGDDCLDCASDNSCGRCTSSKFLENGQCVSECSVRGSDGTPSFSTSQNPFSRVCNTPDPTEEPALAQNVIIGIAAGSGALLLVIVIVILYISCDKRCSKDLDDYEAGQTQAYRPVDMGDTESFAMNSVYTHPPQDDRRNSMYSGSVVPPTPKDRAHWQQTVRHLRSTKLIENATYKSSPQTEHIIDSIPMTTLSKQEAQHIFKHLATMKEDKVLFALLLKDMQARRDTKESLNHNTDKYDKLIADLTLVLRMFDQSKDNTTFPIDCMTLLNWAKMTLDQYVNARAAKTGATTTASNL